MKGSAKVRAVCASYINQLVFWRGTPVIVNGVIVVLVMFVLGFPAFVCSETKISRVILFVGFLDLILWGACRDPYWATPEEYESTVSNDQDTTNAWYSAAIQLIVHAENISWTRIYNLFTANSILLLAWATIVTSPSGKASILIALSLAGFILSLAWVPLGQRGRRYVRKYLEVATKLEKDNIGPVKFAHPQKEGFLPFARAERLAVLAPLGFAIVFWFVLLKSVCLWK